MSSSAVNSSSSASVELNSVATESLEAGNPYTQVLHDTWRRRRVNSNRGTSENPSGGNTAAAYALELLWSLNYVPARQKKEYADIDNFQRLMDELNVHVVSKSNNENDYRIKQESLRFKDAWAKYFKEDFEQDHTLTHTNGHAFIINYKSLAFHAARGEWTNILLAFAIIFTAFGVKWDPVNFAYHLRLPRGAENRHQEDHLTENIAAALNKGVAEYGDNVDAGGDIGKHIWLRKINLTDIYATEGRRKIAYRKNVSLVYSREHRDSESYRWDALVLYSCEDIDWKPWKNESEYPHEGIFDIPWVIKHLGQSIFDSNMANAQEISEYLCEIMANPHRRRVNNITLHEELFELSFHISVHSQRFTDLACIPKGGPWPALPLSGNDIGIITDCWQDVEGQTNKLNSLLTSMMTTSETRQVRRLTILAAIFIPLSFVGTCFSMNIKEITGSGLDLWLFFAFSVPLTIFSVALTSFWEPVTYHLPQTCGLVMRKLGHVCRFVWDILKSVWDECSWHFYRTGNRPYRR